MCGTGFRNSLEVEGILAGKIELLFVVLKHQQWQAEGTHAQYAVCEYNQSVDYK